MQRCSSLAVLAFILAPSLAGIPSATAQTIVALSDTDMVPTVYETGELGPIDTNHRDTLTVITSPASGSHSITKVNVSNSTFGPPGSLDISPDGRYAFVAETYLPRPPGATRLIQLRQGETIRSIDLAGDKPAVIDSIKIGTQPQTIQVNP